MSPLQIDVDSLEDDDNNVISKERRLELRYHENASFIYEIYKANTLQEHAV